MKSNYILILILVIASCGCTRKVHTMSTNPFAGAGSTSAGHDKTTLPNHKERNIVDITINENLTKNQVQLIWGNEDYTVGSGLVLDAYRLSNGQVLQLGFLPESPNRIYCAILVTPSINKEEVLYELKR